MLVRVVSGRGGVLCTADVRLHSTLADKLREVGGSSRTDRETRVRSGSETDMDSSGEPFREMYVMPKRKLRAQIQLEQMTGRTAVEHRSRMDLHDRLSVRRPRSEEMPTDQDWPSVWPSARTFSASVVPLPIRMGTRPDPEKRAPFKKQGNLELVKVPNFLHLTPAAIARHCEAIKQFCTEYPKELIDNPAAEAREFPVQLEYNTYVHQGTSIRDNRARVVTTSLKLSALNLDSHARAKLIRLVGNRYDEATDTLTIMTDRCPTRKQNMEYTTYLLTVLYHEARKMEKWEELQQREDNLKVEFRGSETEKQLLDVLKNIQNNDALDSPVKELGDSINEEDLMKHPKVEEFASIWERYRNQPETPNSAREYAAAVRQLLGVKSVVAKSEAKA